MASLSLPPSSPQKKRETQNNTQATTRSNKKEREKHPKAAPKAAIQSQAFVARRPAGFVARRPAGLDRPPGGPGAACAAVPQAPQPLAEGGRLVPPGGESETSETVGRDALLDVCFIWSGGAVPFFFLNIINIIYIYIIRSEQPILYFWPPSSFVFFGGSGNHRETTRLLGNTLWKVT